MRDRDWCARRRSTVVVAMLLAVLATLAGAGSASAGALKPKRLATAAYGTVPIGFARTADGSLHVALETNTSWGNGASGIAAIRISPSGQVGPTVQALAWGGPNSGSPNGIPGLAVLGSGALEAVFGGSPSGDEGPWGISSTDGGQTWATPVNVGSGALKTGDSNITEQAPGGSPVLTAGCCGNVVIQNGFGLGAATYQLTNANDDAAGNTASAVDAATGAVVASWDSNAGSGGIWMQQATPTAGAAMKAPIPAQYGTGAPLILAGRDSGPGIFAAYPSDFGPSTHVRLLRYGGGSVAVGSVKGLHAAATGVATGLDGRVWVMWAGQVNGHGVTAVTRSNRAVTRFEPIQSLRASWSSLFTLSGDGRLGPLDLLMSAIPDSAPLTSGIYYARVLPELSVSVAVAKAGKKSFKLHVTVLDAGDAVKGAIVKAGGSSAKTSAQGVAKLTIKGSPGDHVTISATAPAYHKTRVRVRL